MKSLFSTILFALIFTSGSIGQSMNWSTDTTANKMIYFNVGYDYGLVTQLGYGYKFKDGLPLWLQLDFSRPMGGDNVFDDFKTRLGAQYQALSYNKFKLTTRVFSNYRIHQSEFVSMKSFGAEASIVLGWYGSKWIAELEGGFDKAIITQLNHTDLYKENYSKVKDGWYLPAGGNWFYGIKVGRSFGKGLLVSLEMGATNAQGSDQNALVPRYFEIGLVKPF